MNTQQTNASLLPLSQDEVRVIALSGYGDIGRNMTIIETEKSLIIIDVGVMFTDGELPGVDLIISDYSYVLDRIDKLEGIFFTHGHEDHIGAAPYLFRDLVNHGMTAIPAYGLGLTRSLLSGKISEHGLKSLVNLHAIQPGELIELTDVDVEFFSVAHSIPDSAGLIVHTSLGALVHTGDFKIDHTPILGQTTDLARLSEVGDSGTFLLCSDSTYADVPGMTPPEESLRATFEQIVEAAPGRIIFATFASLISRIQLIVDAAQDTQKKFFLTGRSMLNATKYAQELGHLHTKKNLFMNVEQFKKNTSTDVIIVCTGSQGETNAALSRMANGTHQQVEIRPGDTIVLSSNPIPGNEKAVFRNINKLVELGANVIHNKIANVHVRGHAAAEELKLVQRLVRPDFILPAQGEHRHLHHHRILAGEIGMAEENILVGSDGDVFDFCLDQENSDEPARTVLGGSSKIVSDYVYIDNHRNQISDLRSIQERKNLSTDGLISLRVHITETGHSKKIAVRVKSVGIDYSASELETQIKKIAEDLISAQQDGISRQDLETLIEDEVIRNLKLLVPQRPELLLDIIFTKQY
jgi:ribonuclease J